MTTQPNIADDTPDGDPTLHGANEPTITPDPARRERQADPADRAGDQVGHYKLLSKLGEGEGRWMLETKVMRDRNRVADTLADATAIIEDSLSRL